LKVYSQHTPSPRGGAQSNWDQFKGTVMSLYTFPRISHWRLHFPRFRKLRIHPPLYKGNFSQSPRWNLSHFLTFHFWPLLTWASECLQVHAPPFQCSNWRISTTNNHRIKEYRQSPSDQVRSVILMINKISHEPLGFFGIYIVVAN